MSTVPQELEGRIRRMYTAFNARDMDGVFAELSDDVLWANAFEGGHVSGTEGIRDYWTRQWSQFSPDVQPEQIDSSDDGRVVVRVHQVVSSLDGSEVLSDTIVQHTFTFTDGLISRFDVS